MAISRPRRRKGLTLGDAAAKTRPSAPLRPGRRPTAELFRWTYPPAPVRQARKGRTIVGLAEALSVPAFYAATRVVATQIAGLPVLHRESNKPVSLHNGFFADPCDDMTWRQLVFGTIVNLVVHGNSYWLIQDLDRMGRVSKVYPVPPEQIRIQRRPHAQGGAGQLEYYTLTGVLAPYDLFHFKLFPVGGHDVSLSPLVALARAFALWISESESALNVFEDGVPPGYWTTTAATDTEYLKETAREISESSMGGRGHGTAVLDRGMEYKTPGMTFEELELLKSRQWSAAEAAQVVGVPAHLVGAPTYDSETYSSVLQDLELFARINLNTYRDCIVDTLIPMGMEIAMPDADLVKLTPLDQASADKIDIESGVRTVNDCRAARGLEPVDGGDLRPWERGGPRTGGGESGGPHQDHPPPVHDSSPNGKPDDDKLPRALMSP